MIGTLFVYFLFFASRLVNMYRELLDHFHIELMLKIAKWTYLKPSSKKGGKYFRFILFGFANIGFPMDRIAFTYHCKRPTVCCQLKASEHTTSKTNAVSFDDKNVS